MKARSLHERLLSCDLARQPFGLLRRPRATVVTIPRRTSPAGTVDFETDSWALFLTISILALSEETVETTKGKMRSLRLKERIFQQSQRTAADPPVVLTCVSLLAANVRVFVLWLYRS